MKREEKKAIIDKLTEQINGSSHFYLTDISGLNAEQTSKLRRQCFKEDIQLVVVKNTLLKKALENATSDFDGLDSVLKKHTSIMFTETGNAPAKLIKEFRKANQKPLLKAAYVEQGVYIGDEQLESLTLIKSREELIGDIIGLLQSPIKNVISGLQSGGNILTGVLKTLSEKES